ncbi:hypothetical protein Acr_10g0000430 [Actinidia rufa]|uniref:Uncharacterized protein n=1 Tax=Actinidia rufa TaxID=165716 RepID=A0A7J0F7I5_9ERIC|nr:hypothetical protein Acr_10g0000430 [Actinidia rufa]
MRNLRLLHLNAVKIKGGFKDFPKRLTWLSWHRFSLKSIPSDFPMESLVALDLSHSKLEHVWKGTKCNVSSDGLARSLGSLSLLQDLNLSMNPISSLPESIKYLTMLKSLKLDSCKRLQSLPELPNSLTMLNAGYCSSLQMVSSPPNLFTSLELDMSGCEKLVEVQGIFTLMPIGNVNPEIIKNLALDLVKLESMGNLNLKFFNHMTRVINNGQVQVLYECGVYNILLPRSWFRGLCCDFKRTGSVLLFNVPSHANHKIQALNVYILYAYAGDKDPPYWKYIFPEMDSFDSPSSSTFFDYYRQLFGHDFDQDWLWSSHWKNGHQVIIEGGDHIVVVAEETKDFMVKEVGVEIVWDEDLENGRQHHTNVDLSPYLDRPGRYFLNHYYPYPYQVYYEKLQGNATTEVESHLYSITRSMLEPYFSATTTI